MSNLGAVVKYVFSLIPNESWDAILMLLSDDRWTLPVNEYQCFGVPDYEFCRDIQRSLRKVLGSAPRCSLLYRAYMKKESGDSIETGWQVNVVETDTPIIVSGNAIWVSKSNFVQLKISSSFAGMRGVIRSFLFPQKSETRVYRVPWAKPGWFRKTSEWVAKQLSARGYGKVTDVVQVWNRLSAHVIRFDTERARFFVKASHPAVEEAAFTQWLSKMFPESVPKVLQTDELRNVFIMEDFSTAYEERRDVGPQEMSALYEYFGKMQLQSVELMRVPENIIGIPKSRFLRPQDLISEIGNLLKDSELHGYMEDGEIETFRSHSSTWVEMCEGLTSSGIPCSIVHRDLFFTNFARPKQGRNGFLIFDWFHGCISHPFIHLRQLRDTEGMSEKGVESYLSLWKSYVTDIEKLKWFERLAGMVQALVDAVDFFRVARKSEATKQGEIVTPQLDERRGTLKAVVHRLRLLVDFAQLYKKMLGVENSGPRDQ